VEDLPLALVEPGPAAVAALCLSARPAGKQGTTLREVFLPRRGSPRSDLYDSPGERPQKASDKRWAFKAYSTIDDRHRRGWPNEWFTEPRAKTARLNWYAGRGAIRVRGDIPGRAETFAHHVEADLCLLTAITAADLTANFRIHDRASAAGRGLCQTPR
jgi:hypothetical protein